MATGPQAWKTVWPVVGWLLGHCIDHRQSDVAHDAPDGVPGSGDRRSKKASHIRSESGRARAFYRSTTCPSPVREFAFEVALCASLESDEHLVSRQLGAHVHGRRVVDTLLVTPGPEFDERVAITPETIPDAALAADVGTGRARYWRDAFDGHPDHARSRMERAVDVGFLERERRNGRTYVRQAARYPEWFGDLVAIENKPDLDRPGDLEMQLRTDVSLGLVDRVILATASHVTGAHRNRIPDEVGIWRYDPESGERTVLREPERLPVTEPGVEPVEQHRGKTDVRIASTSEKARARRRLAERAYGKGWRTYDLPACAECEPDASGLPYCAWKDRPVRESDECGVSCAGYEPITPDVGMFDDVDFDRLRAANSPWDPDPPGRARTQSGLDKF